MNQYRMLFALLLAGVICPTVALAQTDTPKKTSRAWTLDEAQAALRLDSEDAYLQYVYLQLARNRGEWTKAVSDINSITRNRVRQRRGRQVDLFSLFTGALAVQESLQLDAMRPEDIQPAGNAGGPGLIGQLGDPRKEIVPIDSLKGPTVQSHPWDKMLAAQKVTGNSPKLSPLAACVPEDQYFVLFHSVEKLLETSELGDLWGAHLVSQTTQSAKTYLTTARIKRQLAVSTDPLTRPFYDRVIDEVAMTGSDLYFRTGNDVTLLFSIKQPAVFRLRMDGFLDAAEKSIPDVVRSTGTILGVEYTHLTSPDRALHVFSAYPRENLHLRSNSKIALTRLLETINGKTKDGRKATSSLADSTEFQYLRTLMRPGSKEEDGFVYLSDPFIRRVVGAESKLTNIRRLVCYNHLRMIGNAMMLYRTQYGTAADSFEQLAKAGCAPGVFGQARLRCPCGGEYHLDGEVGVCSRHGRADRLLPCVEIPQRLVTKEEADEYRQFVERYSQYWRTFFDPIAIRLKLTPEQYRVETIILPLINNSIYTGMNRALGGEPEPLDTLPIPERNIFSTVVRLNKREVTPKINVPLGSLWGKPAIPPAQREKFRKAMQAFLTKGIGNQVGFHVCDGSPTFDLNFSGLLGEMTRDFGRGRGGFDDDMLPAAFMIGSLNAPVYVAIPVEDAKVVDQFLEQLDALLALYGRVPQRTGWFDFDYDFYRVPLTDLDEPARCFSLQMGPIKWRAFFARIGDGLYVASKPFILEDLAKLEHVATDKRSKQDPGPEAHAMIRIRPEHWDQVLTTFQLGWEESSRQSCLNNLGPISSVARAMTASTEVTSKTPGSKTPGSKTPDAKTIRRRADALHAVHFFCPDGGRYELSQDGKQVVCPIHGTAQKPRQTKVPASKSPMGRLMSDFAGATASLTFLEDGLHAVVTIDRKH